MAHSSGRFSGIFICYRRDDSAGHAGRLYDQFVRYFGDEHVFMDLDRIEPGEDFEEVIGEAVGSCETLIVLIGRDWLTTRDEKRRRLDNPKDFVRLEITAALERKIRVVPVLVQGASMPRPEDLPDELSRFSRRQAFELSDRRWKQDVARLINSLERTLEVRRIIAPYVAAEPVAAPQGHEAEEVCAQAEAVEPEEPRVDVPLFVPAARPVALQRADERTQEIPLFVPAAKPVVLQLAGEHKVVQAKEQPVRIRKLTLATLVLGVAAGIVWAVLIIWWVVENQDTKPAIASAAQAGQSIVPEPTPTPEAQPDTGLRSGVAPTPPEKTPTPAATPRPTAEATTAAVSASAALYHSGLELWRRNRTAALEKFRDAAAEGEYQAAYDYYRGLNLVQGSDGSDRDLSKLKKATLREALGYFQRLPRGPFADRANPYVIRIKQVLDKSR